MTSILKRNMLPEGSNLATDRRTVIEGRGVTAGGLPAGFGLRRQSTIERMRVRGQITARQAEAGERLYRCWSLGVAGAREESRGCAAWSPGGMMDAQLDALTSYRGAVSAIGKARFPLLFAVAIEDWTVARFTNERGYGRDGTGEVLRSALEDLADYFRV